jgi:hypothetical protein
MPWSAFQDPDDAIHDWLKTKYTPYRNALGDPTVLPVEDDVEWDTFWSGLKTTSFMVTESEPTLLRTLGMGPQSLEFISILTVRVTYRYIVGTQKPPELKQIREFIEKTLWANVSPVPAALIAQGIVQMVPVDSMVAPESRSAQEDFWVLNVRVQVRVINKTT